MKDIMYILVKEVISLTNPITELVHAYATYSKLRHASMLQLG